MDLEYDIFALDDDDDDIDDVVSGVPLSSMNVDNNLSNKSLVLDENIMPEMNCSGADSWNSQFSSKGFIRNSFIVNYQLNNYGGKLSYACLSIYEMQSEDIFDDPQFVSFLLDKACINVQNLVNEINEQQLGNNNEKKFNKSNNYDNRRKVTILLYTLLHTNVLKLWPMIYHHVQRLRSLVNSITTMDVLKRIYNAHHARGNSCESPAYHLLHGILEWKLLDLCLLHKNQQGMQVSATETMTANVFFLQLERIFDDLIACTMFLYLKKNTAELLYSTPFACTCFREIWLFLQLALTQWHESSTTFVHLDFWSIFNASITRLSTKLGNLLKFL